MEKQLKLKVLNSKELTLSQKNALIVKFMRDEEGIHSSKNTEYTPVQYSELYNRGKAFYDTNQKFKSIYNKLKTKEENKSLSYIELVSKFRDAFNLKIKSKPSLLTKSEYDLHYKLLKEEINEYMDACEEGDKTEVLDALVDIAYILYGAVLHHGMQDIFDEAFKEVHASNMSKLENGKPLYREDGKVLKGKDYFTPDFSDMLNQQ